MEKGGYRVDVSIANTSAQHSFLLLVMGPWLGLGKYYELNCVSPTKKKICRSPNPSASECDLMGLLQMELVKMSSN